MSNNLAFETGNTKVVTQPAKHRIILGVNYPLHFIPAYYLPVYASQYTLPCTTQDSVLDCWLGFVKAVISNHMCSLSLARRNRHNSDWRGGIVPSTNDVRLQKMEDIEIMLLNDFVD